MEKLSRREFLFLPTGFFGKEDVQDEKINRLKNNLNTLADVFNHNTTVFDARISILEERIPGIGEQPDKTQV